MDQQKFDEKEALNVIEEMVNSGRYKMKKEAKFFLLWGWMVFAAAIIQFFFVLAEIDNSWIVWPALMGLAFIIYLFMVNKTKREGGSSTYIDRVNKYLWLGFFGPLLITILTGVFISWAAAYPFFMAIYGWSAIVSGGLLKFKPLVNGGIVSCILGVATIFVPGMYILLMLALAIFAGFIIPGHVLRSVEL